MLPSRVSDGAPDVPCHKDVLIFYWRCSANGDKNPFQYPQQHILAAGQSWGAHPSVGWSESSDWEANCFIKGGQRGGYKENIVPPEVNKSFFCIDVSQNLSKNKSEASHKWQWKPTMRHLFMSRPLSSLVQDSAVWWDNDSLTFKLRATEPSWRKAFVSDYFAELKWLRAELKIM